MRPLSWQTHGARPGRQSERTVGVPFARLVPDASHAKAIGDAVERVHRATLLATELLSLHARDRFENHGGEGLEGLFDANWLLNAYNEVTFGRGKPKVIGELRATRDAHMPAFEPVDRTGLTVLLYECRNLAAVASNNVWMHFRRRVLGHVRPGLALDDAAFNALTKEQRRARRLALMQVADDLLRPPSEPSRCPEERRAWVAARAAARRRRRRRRLGRQAARVPPEGPSAPLPGGDALHDHGARGGGAVGVRPLPAASRARAAPRPVRPEGAARAAQTGRVGAYQTGKNPGGQAPQDRAGRVDLDAPTEPTKRERRSKADMADEKAELFAQVLDLRAAKLSQRDRFDWAASPPTTCARRSAPCPRRAEGWQDADARPLRDRRAQSQSRASSSSCTW